MSSQYDQALETVLTAARQFAEIVQDDEGKDAHDKAAEQAIWEALELLGHHQTLAVDPVSSGGPSIHYVSLPQHEIEHNTAALVADKPPLMVPTVHLNGTSRDELIEHHIDAIRSVREAERRVSLNCPNGRDFYTQGPKAITEALRQHHDRLARLRAVGDELEEIAEKI